MCGVPNGRVGVAEDDGVVQVRPADHPEGQGKRREEQLVEPRDARSTGPVESNRHGVPSPWDAPVSSDSMANSDNGDEDIILAERAGRKT
jgi:hypothetical protein